MGNILFNRRGSYHVVENTDRAMFEPFIDSEEEREERNRIAEAFHFSGPAKKDEKTDDSSDDETTNPAEEDEMRLIDLNDDENSKATEHPKAKPSVDPFTALRQTDGWTVIIHVLTPSDTLAGLSLRYNVSTDDIRRANFMTDDRLISFTRLIIPAKGSRGVVRKNDKILEIEVPEGEKGEEHKMRLVGLLKQMDPSSLGSSAAEYYLERSDFNLRRALAEVEKDAAWEKQHLKVYSPGKSLPWNLNGDDAQLARS